MTSSPSPFLNYDTINYSHAFQNNFRQLLFGKHHSLFISTLQILSSDKDFLKTNEIENGDLDDLNNRKYVSFKVFKKFFLHFNLNQKDYMADPRKFSIYADALYILDNATGIRLGVDFDLYLRTLVVFGTKKHLPYIKKLFALSEIGCFALGELAHGSNSREIQTLATYSIDTDEFILNTTNEHAVKFWIGSACHIAINAVVFARLIISDVSYGIHAFIVPLRKKLNHSMMEGVYIGDCGKKIGLNNKDEGFLIFRNARVPRENLLDRYCKVNNKGEYKSLLKTQNDRFGFMIGSIMNEARIFTANRSLLNLMKGLLITTRFLCARRQFHKEKIKANEKAMGPEAPIIEYELTQYRLMPFLAGTVVLKIAARKLHDKFEENRHLLLDFNNPKMVEMHAVICSIKAISTWYSKNGLSNFRELCGGLGYSHYNRIGEIYNDNIVNIVWEGDNYVLLQQSARYILDYYNNLKTKNYKPEEFELLSFLKKEDLNVSKPIYFIQEKKDFLNPKFLLQIFERRFIFVLENSIKEFNKNIEKTRDIFTAWNLSQVNHLKELAIVFGELFIMKENLSEINNVNLDKDTTKIIRKLLTLWSLNLIYEKIDMNFHFFNKIQINILKDLIIELCFELKDKCISIVETFSFPDEILNSPIGVKSGDIYGEFLKKIKLVNAKL